MFQGCYAQEISRWAQRRAMVTHRSVRTYSMRWILPRPWEWRFRIGRWTVDSASQFIGSTFAFTRQGPGQGLGQGLVVNTREGNSRGLIVKGEILRLRVSIIELGSDSSKSPRPWAIQRKCERSELHTSVIGWTRSEWSEPTGIMDG